jgi:hypothetical protein
VSEFLPKVARRLAPAVLFAVLAYGTSFVPARGDAIASYDTFVKGAQAQHGLFTIWRKDGKVYLELSAAQLNRDYIQTIVPSSGLAGNDIVWGNTDHLPAELVRFERAGSQVAILWPSPSFVAPGMPEAAAAIARNFPRSTVGLATIAAQDEKSGALVIDAAPFLSDQLDLRDILKASLEGGKDAEPYSLDNDRTYFGSTKAFPRNVVIEVMQNWTSPNQRLADVPPDPRNVQLRVVYNLAEPPANDGYVPRYADDRVGFYDDIYLEFDNDRVLNRKLTYAVRWNFQPSDPSKPLSPALHPMIFYMSNTVPQKYRAVIRSAVLRWNAAFEKAGIGGALEVRDQPSDPDWDPDDIRYNVLRWVPEHRASFDADSQTLFDPRTGEEFRAGVLISADVPVQAQIDWTTFVDPVRYGRTTDPMPQQFLDDNFVDTMLHETGHNLGLNHNFIASMAYTARQLQDPAFTSKSGVASSVMEYSPLNLWPQHVGQGDYYPTTLGPYDYYAVHWGYARVPGAATPEDERPTLSKWASAWSDPRFRFASDEDGSWADGHASDPRVNTNDLTNDPLTWCAGQLRMYRGEISHLNDLFPQIGQAYEPERDAFTTILDRYALCAQLPAHFIGGQYLSRAHRGDPGAQPPIVPVPKSEQRRAFEALDRGLFAGDVWSFPASLLQRLGYSAWGGYGYGIAQGPYGSLPAWAYDPPARHDLALGTRVAGYQKTAIDEIFQPLVLARLEAGASESVEHDPMRLSDLFDWMQAAVYRELSLKPVPPIERSRRELQQLYLAKLGSVANSSDAGMPSEARALARAELVSLESAAAHALHAANVERETRAHLELLRAEASDALASGKR